MPDPLPNSDKTLNLVCPDWRDLEAPLQLPDPYVLWQVGDQPLLYHWFDYAQDKGYTHIHVYVSDRPARVRTAIENATLWPLDIECTTISCLNPDMGIVAESLPDMPLSPTPKNGWDLLDHWQRMDKRWLAILSSSEYDRYLSIGKLCRIHPSAQLEPPYFIGDQVSIGPDAIIGPNAILGNGAMVAEGSIVRNSRLMNHTFLGAELSLENSILNGGVLYQCKHRARVNRLESFLADSVTAKKEKPPLAERLQALWWWLKLRLRVCRKLPVEATTPGLNGQSVPGLAHTTLGIQRLPWLWEAFRGRMRLFGPLPRSEEQLAQLPSDWQAVIREALPGAIAYSDCLGCHSPHDPMEALHAVYQITHPERTAPQCALYLKSLS